MKNERLYLEEPTLKRKNEAIEYIEEHIKFNSNINGSGSLDNYLKNSSYEEWLNYLETVKNGLTNFVPASTYFLIRKYDDKIIGMVNIRHELNSYLYNHGGHIGYGIRPTERRKGYNKINLYLALLKCKDIGIDKVLLTVYDSNLGSIKTIKALGGKLENKVIEKNTASLLGRYWIYVDDSIGKYKDMYDDKIIK